MYRYFESALTRPYLDRYLVLLLLLYRCRRYYYYYTAAVAAIRPLLSPFRSSPAIIAEGNLFVELEGERSRPGSPTISALASYLYTALC